MTSRGRESETRPEFVFAGIRRIPPLPGGSFANDTQAESEFRTSVPPVQRICPAVMAFDLTLDRWHY